jgi:hypothetical protein
MPINRNAFALPLLLPYFPRQWGIFGLNNCSMPFERGVSSPFFYDLHSMSAKMNLPGNFSDSLQPAHPTAFPTGTKTIVVLHPLQDWNPSLH